MASDSPVLPLSKARSFLGQGVVDRLQVAAEGYLSGVLDGETCKPAFEHISRSSDHSKANKPPDIPPTLSPTPSAP